ncbi:MAG: RNA polymerase sigma factor [Phycisphaerales bacterium]|nr:RNA polymerase sigma factor [Phycisphaerales bacterium]
MDKAVEVEIIRKAKAGDGRAIEALIRAHQDALYAFMLRLSGRPEIAEDVVQEAFVRVLKNLDRFDTRFRFSTWVFTIAKRLYVNAMQKHAPSFDSDIVGGWQGRDQTPGALTAETEYQDQLRGLLDDALGDLNDQQREIILLFHQQCWGITEIADHLDMPEGTVKSHLHRARKRMKRYILALERGAAFAEETWS